MPFRLLLSGRVELKDGEGRILTLRTRKVTLLLAILAVAQEESGPDGWKRREELAELVWEEAEPDAGRLSLRNALHALRRTLGPDAVRSQGDSVALAPAILALEEGEGEFMPGYKEEWAIERRLRRRAETVAQALDAARADAAAGRWTEALAHAVRACAADPLDPEATRVRAKMLARVGRRAEAAEAGLAHRVRVVRELGFAPPAPVPAPVENPLLRTFEWTMERDPNEACALLAATSNQWLWSGVETALEVHQRVLAASHRPSFERKIVGAVASFLEVSSGRYDRLAVAAQRHREAVEAREPQVAGLLCYPLAEGYAARGEFAQAAAYREEAVHYARARGGANAAAPIALAENSLGMFEGMVGNLESGYRRIEAAASLIEEDGAPLRVWAIRWSQAAAWIERGRFDRAAERIELCHRAATAYGGDRFIPWIVGSEARLHERMGDLPAAREAFLRMRAIAPGAGESVVVQADEGLMRVHCGLREYGEAAEAWARAERIRRRTGTVASPFERALSHHALQTLRERASRSDLQATFRRSTTG